jgi:hypothetical protein
VQSSGTTISRKIVSIGKQDETNVLLSCRNSPGHKKLSADRILSADGRSTFDNFAPYWWSVRENQLSNMISIVLIYLLNSLTAIRVLAGTKNSRPVGFLQ